MVKAAVTARQRLYILKVFALATLFLSSHSTR
jgi:hypothetical protein